MHSIPALCRKIMDPDDRVAYFSGHNVTTETRMLPNIDKAKGSLMPVSVMYRPLCRGVRVGDWHASIDVAVSEGGVFLRRWDGRVRS